MLTFIIAVTKIKGKPISDNEGVKSANIWSAATRHTGASALVTRGLLPLSAHSKECKKSDNFKSGLDPTSFVETHGVERGSTEPCVSADRIAFVSNIPSN